MELSKFPNYVPKFRYLPLNRQKKSQIKNVQHHSKAPSKNKFVYIRKSESKKQQKFDKIPLEKQISRVLRLSKRSEKLLHSEKRSEKNAKFDKNQSKHREFDHFYRKNKEKFVYVPKENSLNFSTGMKSKEKPDFSLLLTPNLKNCNSIKKRIDLINNRKKENIKNYRFKGEKENVFIEKTVNMNEKRVENDSIFIKSRRLLMKSIILSILRKVENRGVRRKLVNGFEKGAKKKKLDDKLKERKDLSKEIKSGGKEKKKKTEEQSKKENEKLRKLFKNYFKADTQNELKFDDFNGYNKITHKERVYNKKNVVRNAVEKTVEKKVKRAVEKTVENKDEIMKEMKENNVKTVRKMQISVISDEKESKTNSKNEIKKFKLKTKENKRIITRSRSKLNGNEHGKYSLRFEKSGPKKSLKIDDSQMNNFYTVGRKELRETFKESLEMYTEIRANTKDELLEKDDESAVCFCNWGENEGTRFCDSNSICVNRATFVECEASNCVFGEKCKNMKIQTSTWPKVTLKRFEEKGVGLVADETIKRDQLVCEYFGEVISLKECRHRLKETYKFLEHSYIFRLSGDHYIDATEYGNLSRFINHSCNPNMRAEIWSVNGKSTVAFFTEKQIKKGQELTYDYNYDHLGFKGTECKCGSSICKGILGKKKSANAL